MINIAIEQGEDRRDTIRQAVEQLGDEFIERCRNANQIFIKVNLVDHERYFACTHIDAVRGLIDVIRERSNTSILIGDAGYRGTKAAFSNFGYDHLGGEYSDITLVDLNDDEFVDGYTIKSDDSQNPIRRSKIATSPGFKISLSPMKTDAKTGASLTVQNWAIGTWIVPPRISASGQVWARWPWLDSEGEVAHHQSIAELFNQQKCHLGIVDGIMAMEGDGPVRGTRIDMGVVLAGFDPVAVDSAAATLMGIDPLGIGYLKACHEMGVGVADMTRINVPPMQMAQLRREFKRNIKSEI